MLAPIINYYDADMSQDDTPRAMPIVKVWTGSGWIVKMIDPLEVNEFDFADDDTPCATHSSKPIVKVWSDSGWIDCDAVAFVKQEQVIYQEPEATEEEEIYVKSKADKRLREKKVKFIYKQRTNLYLKPEWTIAPGYSYPGPTSITHKLITAAPAPKIVKPARGDIAARIARSKAVLRRHDKTAFGPEEDFNYNKTHPRRNRITWDNLGLIPPGNYYPTGRIDFWPRGEPSKPFRMSFIDVVNTW